MNGNSKEAPRDLIGFLDFYLVKKAPFQLPSNVKELIVQWGPWITVVLLILSLPFLLFALGIGTMMLPFGGIGYARGFSFAVLVLCLQLGLMVAALPGLFARKMSGWQLAFYGELASIVFSILTGSIVSGLIFGLVALYILFQIRPLYRN